MKTRKIKITEGEREISSLTLLLSTLHFNYFLTQLSTKCDSN